MSVILILCLHFMANSFPIHLLSFNILQCLFLYRTFISFKRSQIYKSFLLCFLRLKTNLERSSSPKTILRTNKWAFQFQQELTFVCNSTRFFFLQIANCLNYITISNPYQLKTFTKIHESRLPWLWAWS